MDSAIFTETVYQEGENPAWDFLVEACALFAPISVEEMMAAYACPFCNAKIPVLWQPLCRITGTDGKPLATPEKKIRVNLQRAAIYAHDTAVTVELFWMQCPACYEVIVTVRRGYHGAVEQLNLATCELWFAVPKHRSPRQIADEVPEPYRTDYIEAATILKDSPRMSSVLSRRILQDLLEQFAGRTEYKLEDRIDNFMADAQYPSNLKENLHHLRDIANFSAHTKKEKATGDIIAVDHDEAEWTLEVVDGLFDYFIVAPERDKQRRVSWDAKRGQTGSPRPTRKPKP
jgi:hypothetical protein